MYETFFGLNERPFDLTADPRFLHLTAKHREALYTLRYGISGRKGVSMLIGDAGTGKTTLVHAALAEEAGANRCIVCVKNPTLNRSEFLEFLTNGFDLKADPGASKSRFLLALERALHERRRAGGLSALIIDEAQALPDELLEEVRLLANLETPTEKLLSVILVGQPELSDRLNDASLRQLKQRVALRSTLQPLNLQETTAYISARIRTAGGKSHEIFTREAVIAIYQRSGGIPRIVSVICDNALIAGFASDQRPVDEAAVIEACQDLDLGQVPSIYSQKHSGSDAGPHGREALRSIAAERAPDDRPTGTEPAWKGFTSFR